MNTTITAPKLARSFSACVIFKKPGRPPARQSRSSSKQSRLVWPSENRSALIFPPFGRSKHEKTVSAQGSLLIRTHQISQTAETSPSCPPQMLARVLLHPALTGLPPFSRSAALCPLQGLSAGTEGPRGGTLLSSFKADRRGPQKSPAQLLRQKPNTNWALSEAREESTGKS